jgi:hypothetical protein
VSPVDELHALGQTLMKINMFIQKHTIKAFKFRAQAILSLLEKTHPPGSQNLSWRKCFHFSTL